MSVSGGAQVCKGLPRAFSAPAVALRSGPGPRPAGGLDLGLLVRPPECGLELDQPGVR